MSRSGTTVLVLVETSTGVFTAVGSQRDASIDRTGDFLDGSSKDSNDEEGQPGRRGSTVTLDACYVEDDAAYLKLVSLYESDPPALCKLRKSEDGTDVQEADAVITAIGQRHPDNDISTVAMSFRVTGGWTTL